MKREYRIKEPYIIGEVAYNNEGDIKYLYKMINDIYDLKLDAIKFHLGMYPETRMQKIHPLFEKTKEWNFSKKQWDEIISYCNKKKLDIIALCDDVGSLKYINKKEVESVEIHSTSLNDLFILEEASKFKGNIILGIGGSTLDEISFAIDFLKNKGKNDITLMYGFQSYPTKYEEINLSKMTKLRDLFNLPIGYADHTGFDDSNNEIISSMAAMMGFNILEKHYTPDYGKERIDYHAAVGKKQMNEIK